MTNNNIATYCRYPSAVTVQWTDILVRSTVLGIHVLGEACATAPLGSSASLHAVSEFYQGLWLQVASILGSLLAAEEDADLAVRSRALWGTIEIANASIRAVLRVASSAQHQEMPHALLVMLVRMHFLKWLLCLGLMIWLSSYSFHALIAARSSCICCCALRPHPP